MVCFKLLYGTLQVYPDFTQYSYDTPLERMTGDKGDWTEFVVPEHNRSLVCTVHFWFPDSSGWEITQVNNERYTHLA